MSYLVLKSSCLEKALAAFCAPISHAQLVLKREVRVWRYGQMLSKAEAFSIWHQQDSASSSARVPAATAENSKVTGGLRSIPGDSSASPWRRDSLDAEQPSAEALRRGVEERGTALILALSRLHRLLQASRQSPELRQPSTATQVVALVSRVAVERQVHTVGFDHGGRRVVRANGVDVVANDPCPAENVISVKSNHAEQWYLPPISSSVAVLGVLNDEELLRRTRS